jgi:DNA-binding SARP family transcriptional activator
MDFHLLGPLEVTDGDRVVPVGGGKPRALLAVLLLHPNEVVSSDRLIDALWGDAPPASAAKNVQLYVFQLRKTLRAGTVPNSADAILETRAGGYVVRLDRSQRDVDRFEHKLEEGRRELADGDRAEAGRILREALALWRGPALAEFRYEPFAQEAIMRLEELRVGALEARIESDLALDRHSELVAELRTLVAQHPLRERLRGQLMLALYRCNRQAEALDAYRDGRRRLVDELGLEPSTTLRDLERAILTGSAELSVPSPQAGVAARRRLPSPPNRTVGRARELGEIADRLRAESVRLLTLTGPGGVGKTRLALDAARTVEADFADGARWVSLAALSRAGAVAGEIARALGAQSLAG